MKRERGEKTQQKNRTKSELKYKEGKNKETERKLSNRREGMQHKAIYCIRRENDDKIERKSRLRLSDV